MKLIGQMYHKLSSNTKKWLVLDPKTWKVVAAGINPDLALERARKKGISSPMIIKGVKVDGFRI